MLLAGKVMMTAGLSAAAQRAWAKSGYDPESKEWCPLWLHLLDSMAVMDRLVPQWALPSLHDLVSAEFKDSHSGMPADEEFQALARWVAGLHDLGKASPAFSSKVPGLDDKMKEKGLRHKPIDSLTRRRMPHGLAGQCALEDILIAHGWRPASALAIVSVVGAHHGIPSSNADVNGAVGYPDLLGHGPWDDVRRELFDLVTERAGVSDVMSQWGRRQWSEPFLVVLSGLTITADWLASTEDYFPLLDVEDRGLDLLEPGVHRHRAEQGWARVDLPYPWLAEDPGSEPDVILRRRFDLPDTAVATSAQVAAVEAARATDLPGLIIVEDSTGSGKTEAALMAAEVLAARSGRSGILFALPTQATTDAMFTRQMDWLSMIGGDYGEDRSPAFYNVQLLHGRARLNPQARALRRHWYRMQDHTLGGVGDPANPASDEAQPTHVYDDEEPTAAAIAAWFSGRKKSMLADFVTTTVDHLLFAAMRAPHLALRHLGLARKVVIIDEVHSYSAYMNVYLDRALTWLAAYGVPVVLLSATLSNERCSSLVESYRAGLGQEDTPALDTPFPCLVVADRTGARVLPTDAGRSSRVRLRRLHHDDLLPLLTERLAAGGCALVIRNTIKRAQDTYEQLREVFGDEVTLNHSRFTISDRLAKDADLLHRFGPPRRHPERPRRAIVVATQVVEQSLDVDFDLLVTDLAPIDLIFQRAGRLHRHDRPRPTGLQEPDCYVSWLPVSSREPVLEPGATAVYGVHDLLRTAAALDRVVERGGWINVPADVRRLMEEVYGDDPQVPPTWREVAQEAEAAWSAEVRMKQGAARSFLLGTPRRRRPSLVGWLDGRASDNDEGHAQVRDSDDSIEVILLQRNVDGGQQELQTLHTVQPRGGAVIPHDRVPDRAVVDSMLRSAIRLPPRFSCGRLDQAIAELESGMVDAWQHDPGLRGQLFLPLTDGRATLAGITLEYDPLTGLKEIVTT